MPPPNILFVMTEQQRFDTIGALGFPHIRTPHLDRLGAPGTRHFKYMFRRGDWKYLWLANGGRELLFNLRENPGESRDFAAVAPGELGALRAEAVHVVGARDFTSPALAGGALKALPFEPFPRVRIRQFSRDVTDFGQGTLRT